jgi:HlyD family secretion protein
LVNTSTFRTALHSLMGAMLRVGVAAVLTYVLLGVLGDRERAAPAFLTAPVERGTIATLVKASGTVEAVVSVDVSSQLSGRMAHVFVSFNDAVKAGQPIAQIDPEIFAARVNEARAALKVSMANARVQRAAVERAKVAAVNALTAKRLAEAQLASIKARLEEAEKELQRKSVLYRTGHVTEQELTHVRTVHDTGAADLRASFEQIQMKAEAITMAEAELQMAEANIENAQAVVEERQAALHQAQVDLDRTLVRAPIDGIIIKRDVNPGQTVAVSLEAKTLFKIANDLRDMEVHGKIDEADVGQLKVGQTAKFTVDAFPNRTFGGKVKQIRKSPEIVQNVVTYTAIISAPNPGLLLLPGMTAQLRIVVSEADAIIKVPSQALRFRPKSAPSSSSPQGPNPPASKALATVWVVGRNGQPRPIGVNLGMSDDNGSELLDGPLAEGQEVIVGIANSQEQRGYFGIRLGS